MSDVSRRAMLLGTTGVLVAGSTVALGSSAAHADDPHAPLAPVPPDFWSGFRTLQFGSTGLVVNAAQKLLADSSDLKWYVTQDGSFGPQTRTAVLGYQRDFSISQTGKIDRPTWKVLVTTCNVRYGWGGWAVQAAQLLVNHYGARIKIDGSYGPATRTAINNFQRARRIPVIASVDNLTWAHLIQGTY